MKNDRTLDINIFNWKVFFGSSLLYPFNEVYVYRNIYKAHWRICMLLCLTCMLVQIMKTMEKYLNMKHMWRHHCMPCGIPFEVTVKEDNGCWKIKIHRHINHGKISLFHLLHMINLPIRIFTWNVLHLFRFIYLRIMLGVSR